MKIYPVILAGGQGTRLWPLSRKSYPKQFTQLIGKQSLFQQSALRVSNTGIVEFSDILTVTNENFRFIVCEQLQSVGINPGTVLIEPEAKDTAPAILAAAYWISKSDPDAVMLVMPSDHLIPDPDAFHAVLQNGLEAAVAGSLVIFGVEPTEPETGYGYLSCCFDGRSAVAPVTAFIEKPDFERAERFISSGGYLWNAGIFLFRARDIIAAFEHHCSELIDPVGRAVEDCEQDLVFSRLNAKHWSHCRSISIDYAIMERAGNIKAVRFIGNWSDLGGWDAIWTAQGADVSGVSSSGNVTAINCSNSLLRSESPGQHLVGLGLDNIVAVTMPDAVLIARKDNTQDVKRVVTELRGRGIPQADQFPKDHRPWGWFESLCKGDRFQVKRILVQPGAALSLQSHHHRSEHWIVVEGTAKITLDGEVSIVTEGQSVYVPLGTKHRLENPGKLPMLLIEVQTGPYLGEDDIVRYDDIYKRR